MKKILSILAIALVASFGFSTSAEAGRLRVGYTVHYTSGQASCGCAIPYYKVFRGYQRCGTPIWRHYRKRIVHNCRSHRVRSHYPRRRHHYSNNHYYSRGGYYGAPRRSHYRR